MKICLVRHAYFPDDPIARKAAFALREAGHDVDVICLRKRGTPGRETVEGVRVFRIPLSHQRRSVARYVFEYLVSFLSTTVLLSLRHLWCPYDCVQIHTLPDFMVYVAWLPKILGSPVTLYVQEPTPELWVTKFGTVHLRWLCRLQAWMQIHAIRFADYSFTVTECLRRALGERGADTARIDVLHNVSDERFEEFVSPPKVREGEFRLITHGSIEERYGHETVLRAMRLLRDRLPGLRYYIPGDGEFLSQLAALVRQLGLEDRVQMPGYLSFNDLRLHQMLHDSDVCVVPLYRSPYSELIDTTKMFECIAMQKPVIVSRLAGVEETFDDTCVSFFKPGDVEDLASRIANLHDHPNLGRTLAESALRRYLCLRWSQTKRKYVCRVEMLAKKSGVRADNYLRAEAKARGLHRVSRRAE